MVKFKIEFSVTGHPNCNTMRTNFELHPDTTSAMELINGISWVSMISRYSGVFMFRAPLNEKDIHKRIVKTLSGIYSIDIEARIA